MFTSKVITFIHSLLLLDPKDKFLKIIIRDFASDSRITKAIVEIAHNLLHNNTLQLDRDCARRVKRHIKLFQQITRQKSTIGKIPKLIAKSKRDFLVDLVYIYNKCHPDGSKTLTRGTGIPKGFAKQQQQQQQWQ